MVEADLVPQSTNQPTKDWDGLSCWPKRRCDAILWKIEIFWANFESISSFKRASYLWKKRRMRKIWTGRRSGRCTTVAGAHKPGHNPLHVHTLERKRRSRDLFFILAKIEGNWFRRFGFYRGLRRIKMLYTYWTQYWDCYYVHVLH